MSFSLEDVQTEILAFLDDQFAQDIIEQAYPDITSVPKGPDGRIKPYLSVRFGDLIQSGPRAMSGTFDDDFRLQLTITPVAPTPARARQLANKVTRVFLGKTFDWAGQVRKRWGGGMLSTSESNAATEAYAFPTAFDITVQLHVSP